jgi:hypothetical protein
VSRARFLALGCLLLTLACAPSRDTPRGAAEAFLDAHYVRIDLEASRELSIDLARAKVDHEITLTEDVEITEETQQPRVNYRLARADEAERSAQYAYELTVRVTGLDPFKRLVMVTVRQGQDGWAVTNYSEGELD